MLAALARPQIGHRSAEFVELYRRVAGKLQQVLETRSPVLLFTSSSTGVWEAAIRNGVRQRVLCCMQGAFSDRWIKVAQTNGKAADELRVDWGRGIAAERIDAALARGRYDAVTVVHNETSTGAMNHLAEIAAVMKRHPDVLFLVDAVSSMWPQQYPAPRGRRFSVPFRYSWRFVRSELVSPIPYTRPGWTITSGSPSRIIGSATS